MKKLLIPLILTFFVFKSNAQVGIGNTNPQAQLDVSASNAATPTNQDGILIPRIDDFPATNPTATQDGMMVFATGSGTPTKGFYYWDNGTTSWVGFGGNGAEKIDDLTDGKSDNDGTNDGSSIFLGINAGGNDDGSNNNNVGIGLGSMTSNTTGYYNVALGFQSLLFNTNGVFNTAIGSQSLYNNTANFNTALGTYSLYENTSGANNTALGYSALFGNDTGSQNIAIGSNAGFYANGASSNNIFLGYYSGSSVAGVQSGSIMIGNFAGFNETANNRLYIENSNANADSALIYGEFDNNVLRTNGEFQIGNPTTTGYAFPTIDGTSGQVMTTDGAGNLSFTTATDTRNTLDGAYDEGGAGAGKNITADSGSVRIDGSDGFLVTGTFGSGNTIDTEVTGAGTRMFFNPNKAAFRAGRASGSEWDDVNIGNYSTAFGYFNRASGGYSTASGNSNTASGTYSTALGGNSTASGDYSLAAGFFNGSTGIGSTTFGYNNNATGDASTAFGNLCFAGGYGSTAFGRQVRAPSAYETAIGAYNTLYTPSSTTGWQANDRLFSIGNGTSSILSNALTIYKDGRMNINDAYTMPNIDGTTGQVLTTNGAGTVIWANSSSDDGDWTIAGNNVYKTTGNVGIGWNNTGYPLSINDDSFLVSMLIDKDNNGSAGGRSIYNDFNYTGSGGSSIYGIYNRTDKSTISTSTGYLYGVYNLAYNRYNGATSSNTYGCYNASYKYDGTTGNSYGVYGSAYNESGNAAIGVYGSASGGATTLYAGYFAGDVYATGAYLPSARQLKIGVQDVNLSSLEKLNQLKIKSYQYDTRKYDFMHLPKGTQVGVIAEEMETFFPELVKKTIHPEADENMVKEGLEKPHGDVEFKAVNYTGLVPHLVKAIQELKLEVESLKQDKQQLEELVEKYQSIEERLSALENN